MRGQGPSLGTGNCPRRPSTSWQPLPRARRHPWRQQSPVRAMMAIAIQIVPKLLSSERSGLIALISGRCCRTRADR